MGNMCVRSYAWAYVFICFFVILFVPVETMSQEKKILTIEEAINIAMKNNADIRSIGQIIESKKAVKKLSWLPEDINLVIENEEIPSGESISSAGVKKRGFVQKIEFPYKWLLKYRDADEELNIVREQQTFIQNEIKYLVGLSFYKIEMLNLKSDYINRNLELLEEFQKKAETKYKVGEAPGIEVLKAKVEVKKGRTELENLKNLIRIEYGNLRFLMNREDLKFSVNTRIKFKPFYPDEAKFKNEYLSNHPKLKESEHEMLSAKIKKDMESWNMVPDFNIGYLKQTVDNRNFRIFSAEAEIPIWFLFKNRNKMQEKKSVFRSRKIDHANTAKKLELAFDSAISSLSSAEKLVNLYIEGIIKESEEIYNKALRGYEEGEYGYLDFWEAQRTLIQSRMEYAGILYEYQTAKLNLFKTVNMYEF